MAFKLIEIATPDERLRAITAVAEEAQIKHVQLDPLGDGRHLVRLLVGEIDRQALLDRLQAALGKSENWSIVMLPTDVVLPREAEEQQKSDAAETGKSNVEDEAKEKADRERASREELYNLVAGGIRVDANFVLLVVLSTVVASVGLEQNSVAVVIGAMVIAPLLGPNVAFSFAAAIGDNKLMLSAARSSILGIVLSITVAAGLTLLVPPNIDSAELLSRTSLDYAGIILGLASGAAAALSVTTGLSSTLVGVMVAVALLPPAATLGIMTAAQRYDLASGAGMLLGANVACVNLAAQVVFVAKGIRPRLWHEKQNARKAIAFNLTTWILLLAALIALIYLRQSAGR
jgi:uncharacterized hydrophobic protein (TIGR00341 family)